MQSEDNGVVFRRLTYGGWMATEVSGGDGDVYSWRSLNGSLLWGGTDLRDVTGAQS